MLSWDGGRGRGVPPVPPIDLPLFRLGYSVDVGDGGLRDREGGGGGGLRGCCYCAAPAGQSRGLRGPRAPGGVRPGETTLARAERGMLRSGPTSVRALRGVPAWVGGTVVAAAEAPAYNLHLSSTRNGNQGVTGGRTQTVAFASLEAAPGGDLGGEIGRTGAGPGGEVEGSGGDRRRGESRELRGGARACRRSVRAR